MLLCSLAGCSTTISKWHTEGPPDQKVQVKNVEYYGNNHNFKNSQIGIAEPVILSFSSTGIKVRQTPLKSLPGPILRIPGAHVSYFSPDLNQKIQNAVSINADPTTLNHELWQTIKSKYPSLTHVSVTLFNVAESYKLSQESHHLPYMWSSSIVCRTIIVDLMTLNAVAEWKQEISDRSTWTDSCSAPEQLARYLVPIVGIK